MEKRLLALRIYYLHPLVLCLFIIWTLIRAPAGLELAIIIGLEAVIRRGCNLCEAGRGTNLPQSIQDSMENSYINSLRMLLPNSNHV
jgi:hypothetical protein